MNRSAETLHYIIEEWAAHIEGLIPALADALLLRPADALLLRC